MSRSLTNRIFTALVFVTAFSMSWARADLMSFKGILTANQLSFANGKKVQTEEAVPVKITNHDTGQQFIAFCGDFTTPVSNGFWQETVGQCYDAYAVEDAYIYTELQRTHINDLFSYAYSTAFDLDGNVIDVKNAQAFQITLWEMLTETTSTLDITSGTFRLTKDTTSKVATTANQWLNALMNGEDGWMALGLSAISYDVTVYIAEGGSHVSQTMISVVRPPVPTIPRAPAGTPEPATLVVFGLGLMGLGLAQTRRQK